MTGKKFDSRKTLSVNLVLLVIFMLACQAVNIGTVPIVATPSPVATDIPVTATSAPPTITPTPPELPPVLQTTILNPIDTPHVYLEDTCQYLKNKWDASKASPGTVVMIIMIKGIYKGYVEEGGGINRNDLKSLMAELKRQNFEAINTKQLLDFLQENAYIPQRSVMIIQDRNHRYENFDEHLGPYWKDWGWPVVNAWISDPKTSEIVWSENIALEKMGFVDHQAGGVLFATILDEASPEKVINRELQGSMDGFQRFEKKPIAYIWQGGGFTQKTVDAAHQTGYQLGFTSNTRGPVMYNWIPLADDLDPARPASIPEGKMGNPLMTLPRYWPSGAILEIDNVRTISKQAIAYAEANKETEMKYYNIVCAPTYGQIPTQ
jgi:hypothetical protein